MNKQMIELTFFDIRLYHCRHIKFIIIACMPTTIQGPYYMSHTNCYLKLLMVVLVVFVIVFSTSIIF